VFCLAKQDSMVVTRLFGGSNGNEGLGFLSISLDWNMISGMPMWLPLQTLVNNTVGYLLGTIIFSAIYYRNTWNSQNFPFLTQMLYTDQSNSTKYDPFNQSLIMDSNFIVQADLVEKTGLPWFSGTFIVYLISTNVAITATFTHLLLWNYKEMKSAWQFLRLKNLKESLHPRNLAFWRGPDDTRDPDTTDPHVKLMLAYRDAPNWWYGMVFVFSILLGLTALYKVESTLPWWGFMVSVILSSVCVLFYGAQYAITGFSFAVQPVIQMLGGYLIRDKPVANMYFTLFGYNSVTQGQLLLRDLKIAQYVHLSPRCTFTMQMFGTIVGSVMGYIMMETITEHQRENLLSISGTAIWSGQTVQTYNSQVMVQICRSKANKFRL
jgi:OPT oligopeptide transporter protein